MAISTYYLDTQTGTWGLMDDLIGFETEPPEDFNDWTDTKRKDWAWTARIRGMLGVPMTDDWENEL